VLDGAGTSDPRSGARSRRGAGPPGASTEVTVEIGDRRAQRRRHRYARTLSLGGSLALDGEHTLQPLATSRAPLLLEVGPQRSWPWIARVRRHGASSRTWARQGTSVARRTPAAHDHRQFSGVTKPCSSTHRTSAVRPARRISLLMCAVLGLDRADAHVELRAALGVGMTGRSGNSSSRITTEPATITPLSSVRKSALRSNPG
jgi:hypothetical protein